MQHPWRSEPLQFPFLEGLSWINIKQISALGSYWAQAPSQHIRRTAWCHSRLAKIQQRKNLKKTRYEIVNMFFFAWYPYLTASLLCAMPEPAAGICSPNSLARLWESDFAIRESLRIREDAEGNQFGGKLLLWPDPKMKVASMQAIAMNIKTLTLLAQWWCPQQESPKTPCIKVLQKEASKKMGIRLCLGIECHLTPVGV